MGYSINRIRKRDPQVVQVGKIAEQLARQNGQAPGTIVGGGAYSTAGGSSTVTGGASGDDYQIVGQKDQASGYAGLDASTLLYGAELPIDGSTINVGGAGTTLQVILLVTSAAAHEFLATPSGGAGVPSLRTIVASDLPAVSAGTAGIIPAWPNNTTTFFRGDGTYAALPNPAILSRQAIASTSGTVNITGNIAGFDSTASVGMILALPQSSTLAPGETFIIQDEGGVAATFIVTLGVYAGDYLNGVLNGTVLINTNYGSKGVYTDGAGKWFIYKA